MQFTDIQVLIRTNPDFTGTLLDHGKKAYDFPAQYGSQLTSSVLTTPSAVPNSAIVTVGVASFPITTAPCETSIPKLHRPLSPPLPAVPPKLREALGGKSEKMPWQWQRDVFPCADQHTNGEKVRRNGTHPPLPRIDPSSVFPLPYPTHPSLPLPARHPHLEGLEWFLYNRTPSFDAIVERMQEAERKAQATMSGKAASTHPPLPRIDPSSVFPLPYPTHPSLPLPARHPHDSHSIHP
jgi:hypothetical protein